MEPDFSPHKALNVSDDDTFLYTGQSVAKVPKDVKYVIVEPNVTTIAEYIFFNCIDLVAVEIPNSVTRIENKAFMKCKRLELIKLPIYLTFIGDLAFAGCSSLVKMEIPPIVTNIGKQAFMQCGGLISMRLPPKLKRIEEGTFAVCGNLLYVDIPHSVMHIDKIAFMQCAKLCILSIPNPLAVIADNTFYESPTLLHGMAYDDEVFYGHLKSRYDDLPLHKVCHGSHPKVEQVEECIKNDPQSAKKTDYLRLTPLHILAINPTVTQKVLQAVVKSYPAAVAQKACFGMTPLHFLAFNHRAGSDLYLPEIIDATTICHSVNGIVDGIENKFLTSVTDRDGRIPTALAIEAQVPLDVQLLLYSRQPIAYEVPKLPISFRSDNDKNGKNRRGDEEESDYLRSERIGRVELAYIHNLIHSTDVTPETLETWSPNLCHGWVKYLCTASPNPTATKELAQFLRSLNRCPAFFARHLAMVEDVEGRRALDVVAAGDVRKALMERVLFLGRYDLDSGPPLYRSENCLVRRAVDRRSDLHYRSVFLSVVRGSSSIASSLVSSGTGEWSKIFLSKNAFISFLETRGFSEDRSTKVFERWSSDKEGQISCHEFVSACRDNLGNGKRDRVVALKFGRDRARFEREREARNGKGVEVEGNGLNSGLVVEVTEYYDVEEKELSLRHWLKRYDDIEGRKELDNGSMLGVSEKDRLQSYCFALVMPCTDRNLGAIIRCERPTMQQVRMYAEDIAMAIKHLHDRNIIHGDISLSNFVRLKGRLHAIDLGASARWRRPFDDTKCISFDGSFDNNPEAEVALASVEIVREKPLFEEGIEIGKFKHRKTEEDNKGKDNTGLFFVGRTFTSGALPPEMIYLCNSYTDVNEFEAYFKQHKEQVTAWNKIEPKVSSNGEAYLIKTFSTSYIEKANPNEPEKITRVEVIGEGPLPYNPILANPAVDMWSFGTLLYEMCTGHSLFHTDTNGNLVDGNAVSELFNWNNETKEAKLTKVACPLARELLQILLSKDPEQRRDVNSALESRFFQCKDFGSEDYMVKVEDLKKDKVWNDLVIEFDRNMDMSTSAMYQTVEEKLFPSRDSRSEDSWVKMAELEKDNVICISALDVKEVKDPTCIVLLPFSKANEFDPSTIVDILEKANLPVGVRVKGINCVGAQLRVNLPNYDRRNDVKHSFSTGKGTSIGTDVENEAQGQNSLSSIDPSYAKMMGLVLGETSDNPEAKVPSAQNSLRSSIDPSYKQMMELVLEDTNDRPEAKVLPGPHD